MSWFDNLARGLGTMNAPFGFAPSELPSQGEVDPAYSAGMNLIGDAGLRILASGSNKPLQAFGQAFGEAQDAARTRNKEQYAAKRLMDEAAENKRKREEEAQRQQWIDEQISQLAPDQQALARMLPEKFFGAQIDQQFGSPDFTTDMKNFQMAQENPEFAGFLDRDNGGGMGKTPIWLRNGDKVAVGQLGDDGVYLNGAPIEGTEWTPMDPGAVAESRASGNLAGKAPEYVISDYTKTTRPAMTALADTAYSLREAKKFLSKGIQTGSMADSIQGLRSLGAELGFNVDESVLSNTQAYQNFIGNTVIPRMAALGGNDSNDELKKLYSLSGGDINQSLAALKDTMDFMERLLKKKYKTLKSSEDVALKFIPGLEPVPFGDEGGGSAVVIDGYSIEED